jgi:proteasome lid subunit RPN8/RPN11
MLILPRHIRDEILGHAKTELPNECCGLLGGKYGVATACYPIENLPSDHPAVADLNLPTDRRLRYVMDPVGQLQAFKTMRETETELVAIYHSHPHTPAFPSATDVRLAFSDVHYLIVSLAALLPVIRAFRISEGQIAEDEIGRD